MAAALRCLGRAAARTLIRPVAESRAVTSASATCLPFQNQIRRCHIDFTKIKVEELDESKLTDFEISRDPEEWQYVERLMPLKIIPKPKDFEGRAPSGWVPPKNVKNLPYFIPRTKNHMQPVYLQLSYRGERKITCIRRIQGDIWQLERELKEFLQTKVKTKYKAIGSRVNEMSGIIKFRGDFVSYVKYWMDTKGF